MIWTSLWATAPTAPMRCFPERLLSAQSGVSAVSSRAATWAALPDGTPQVV